MTFETLLAELRNFPVAEKRTDQPGFFEIVIDTKNLGKLNKLMEQFFGPAVKPVGKNPDPNWAQIVAPLGGIRSDQTLYGFQQNDRLYLAMIWPWGNGVRATIKIAGKS